MNHLGGKHFVLGCFSYFTIPCCVLSIYKIPTVDTEYLASNCSQDWLHESLCDCPLTSIMVHPLKFIYFALLFCIHCQVFQIAIAIATKPTQGESKIIPGLKTSMLIYKSKTQQRKQILLKEHTWFIITPLKRRILLRQKELLKVFQSYR